ncbi:MAG: ribonuclease domain-containing protein [Burkholderiaceae bacterium]
MNKKRLISIIVAAVLAAIFGTGQFDRGGQQNTGSSGQNPPVQINSKAIAFAALPAEGKAVIRQIYQGGPFRYDKDGTVFQNRERRLPDKKRGYYREYTVVTPGERSRGARRVVAGGTARTRPDVMYYTQDHYKTFQRIQGAQP